MIVMVAGEPFVEIVVRCVSIEGEGEGEGDQNVEGRGEPGRERRAGALPPTRLQLGPLLPTAV